MSDVTFVCTICRKGFDRERLTAQKVQVGSGTTNGWVCESDLEVVRRERLEKLGWKRWLPWNR